MCNTRYGFAEAPIPTLLRLRPACPRHATGSGAFRRRCCCCCGGVGGGKRGGEAVERSFDGAAAARKRQRGEQVGMGNVSIVAAWQKGVERAAAQGEAVVSMPVWRRGESCLHA